MILLLTKANGYRILFFFGTLLLLMFIFSDENLHLRVNQYHCSFFDVFFKYVTYLGDGLMFPLLIVPFFFYNKKQSLKFVIAALLTLLITFVLKKMIFFGVPRPIEFFGADKLHLIEGVKMCYWNSFPSGHAMSAFAVFGSLFLYVKNKVLKNVFVVLTILAAFSRVYLSQHFMLDILVGGAIGTGIAVLSNTWTNKFWG
jgi:membrane-associated phospholipid phosphatase